MVYTFSDQLIAHLAQMLQLAILTGTDIIDNFRTVEVCEQDGKLVPTTEWLAAFDSVLDKLQENLKDHEHSTTGDKEVVSKTVGDC
jgi:hypothetical protein